MMMCLKHIYLLIFFVSAQQNLFAQNNFTLVHKYSFASNDTLSLVSEPIHLVVQDSLAVTYFPETLKRLNVNIDIPLGSGHLGKATYYVTNKNQQIHPVGLIYKPKQWRLQVMKPDRGKWMISNEQKIIAGILCTKATGIINNRKCTIWFSEQFPGGYGPHILTNLPGSVFEISYDDIHIKTVAIETSDTALPIIEPNYCKRIKG